MLVSFSQPAAMQRANAHTRHTPEAIGLLTVSPFLGNTSPSLPPGIAYRIAHVKNRRNTRIGTGREA